MKTTYEDERNSSRKLQQDALCIIDEEEKKYKVHEISSNGFSFLCPNSDCSFQKWQILHYITILNTEGIELINAKGSVVHVTEFNSDQKQIGVVYAHKALDRTITGRIRTPRKYPRVRLNATLRSAALGESKSISGYVMDYTASTARIGINKSPSLLLAVELDDEFNIIIAANDKVLLDGQAVVVRKKDDETEIILSFSGGLLDVDYVETVSNTIENQKQIHSVIHSIGEFTELPSEYKALISDWRIFFSRIKSTLDQIETKDLYRLDWEQELFVKAVFDEFYINLNNYISTLNSFADKANLRERALYKKYFRENLNSLIRLSPIAASMIDKDQGYAGDFETVKRFFDNPYVGESLWAKLISKYICSTGAVLAHQDRINYIYEKLVELYRQNNENFSFLTLGSGPAEEVLRFISKNTFSKPVSATLLDMDAFALADFSERLQYLPKENFIVNLVNLNIMNILRKNTADPIPNRFPVTYCAGLFDYLSDGICKKLVLYLIEHTSPGGIVILTNVHKNNFTRNVMDYSFEWEIIHRDEEEMRRLAPMGYEATIDLDRTGTNIYMCIAA